MPLQSIHPLSEAISLQYDQTDQKLRKRSCIKIKDRLLFFL